MSKLTLQERESHLWKSADILRGSVDSSDYKNYIFGLPFLKRSSDTFEEQKKNLIKEHGEEIGTLPADPEQYQFYVPENVRWKIFANMPNKLDRLSISLLKPLKMKMPPLRVY